MLWQSQPIFFNLQFSIFIIHCNAIGVAYMGM